MYKIVAVLYRNFYPKKFLYIFRNGRTAQFSMVCSPTANRIRPVKDFWVRSEIVSNSGLTPVKCRFSK